MLQIGSHLSASKGYLAMGKQAVKLGATTFAFSPGTHVAAVQKPFRNRM